MVRGHLVVYGSSPLTRGKRPSGYPRPFLRGLIPAHAGKTVQGLRRIPSSWAHPRSRGENPRAERGQRDRRGSSPLTRGKPDRDARDYALAGLIPAHAGKTGDLNAAFSHGRAHPRSRGENILDLVVGGGCEGSSPLTRGKRAREVSSVFPAGLIPAHAGKTRASTSLSTTTRAHPRSRGENSVSWTPPPSHTGSSPLTRGKLSPRALEGGGRRLIPAHAGKTRRPGRSA